MHTAAHPAAACDAHWSMFLATMTAMMMWQVPMPMAPMVRTGLRPTRSIHRTEGIVAMSMTMPTTPVARRDVVLPLRPSFWKMKGA
jgi:hypothetical protein